MGSGSFLIVGCIVLLGIGIAYFNYLSKKRRRELFTSFAAQQGFAYRPEDDDQRFGHAVIHPRMMELLLARGEIGWRIEGNSLVGWDKGEHAPLEVMNRLQLLQQVVDQVPPYVWRDYAGVDPRMST